MRRVARSLILFGLLLVAGAAVAQSNLFISQIIRPSRAGAGLAIQCGGDESGVRGAYVCSIVETSTNVYTVSYQDANSDPQSFTFTLGSGSADGVVTSGAINSAGTTLTLTVTTGGTTSTVDITIPSVLRTGSGGGLDEAAVDARIRTFVVFHDGNGPPAAAPPGGGYLALDKGGHLYGSISEQVTHTTDPAITVTSIATTGVGQQLASWWQGYDVATTGTQGHFAYNHYSANFQQRVGSSTQHGRSWHDVLSYIASDGEPPAERINYASTALYLGHFGSDAAAADAFSRNGTAVGRYSSGAPAVASRAYYINSSDRALKRVETFTAGTSTVTDVLTWRDAPLTHVDLRSYVKEFARTGERGVRAGDVDSQGATDGYVLTADGSDGGAWEAASQRAFSTAPPSATAMTAAAGSGTEVSHADHVHDIGDSTIVEADLSAIVTQRLQQPGGIAGQVWTKDSGTNYDASWQTFSAGTTTFIADTDTPTSYTGSALDVVRVNSAGTAVEFVDETPPAHAFPNVGRLPTFSDTSPNIVYLTDSYGLGGRVDATMTRGTDSSGTLTGYSDGEDLSETFGSIDRESPMASLTGGVTGGTYSIQIVTSLNEAWIEEFTHIVLGTTEYALLPTFLDSGVWHRRINGYPENLTAPSFAVNFRRSDGTYYFTNNIDGTFLAGLWEKFDGRYSRLTSKGLVHIDGVGEPTELPTAAAQSYVDDLGRTWISGDMIIHPLSPPMITQANDLVNPFFLPGRTVFELEEPGVPTGSFTYWLNVFWHRLEDGNTIHGTWNSIWSYLVREVPDWENIGRLSASLTTASNQIFLTSTSTETVEVGDFLRINTVEPYEIVEVTAVTDQATFTVERAENGTTAQTWALETRIQLATGNPLGDTAATRRYLNDGIFLGHFASESLAAEERSLYDDNTKDYFFAAPPQESIPREIISYSGPTTIAEDHYFWNGPLITAEDALGVIEDVIIPNPPFADPSEDLFKIYIDGVTYDTESVVHPNRVTGDLRVAVASDWDFACNCALNLAWDGHQLLRADRYLDAEHSADAVFTEVSPLTSFQLGGRTYRWRGENPYSAPNLNDLQDGDFTWWENGIRFLEWVEAHNLWANRNGSQNTYPLLAAINYVGYGANQAQALQQVTADGQRVVFERRPERARGIVRVQGAEGTTLPLGAYMTTAAPSSVQFVLIQAGTIPAAGFIDLRVRARVGGTNGNLADQTPLTLDTAIPAITSIVAQGAFTRGDDIHGDHKLWTVSEFRAAGSDEYRYRWVPAIVPASVSNYLLVADENGVMPAPQAHHYDAARGRSLVLGWDGSQLLEVSRRLTGGHGASATFTQVPDKTDIPGTTPTLRWRYTHWQDALVSDPEFRDVYYRRDNDTFRFRSGDQWLHFTAHEVFEDDSPYVYGGPYDNEADALAHVSALNQWIMYRRATDNAPIMYQVTAFTAPDPGSYVYFWRPLNDDILPPILGPFSSGESTSSDHFYAVKEGDSTAEVGYAVPAGGDSHRLDVVRWEESGTPYWGYQTSPTARGTLHDGSGLDIINILWIEGDTPADRFLGLEFEATSPLNVANNTLRIRLQPVRDLYQAGPNPAAWVIYPMERSLGETELRSTASVPANPFTEGAAQYWIGFDILMSGVWVPRVHAALWGYERILDGDDLSMEDPTRTNTGAAAAGTSDKVARDDHTHPGPPIDSVRIDLSQAAHWYGTGIHMDNQTTFHIHAEGSYFVYETSYNEILGRTSNPDSVGGTPSSGDRWQIPNGTYEIDNDHAPFYVGRTSGSDPQLLIARLDGASTPTHIVVTAFRPSGSSDSSGYRHFVGDDAYQWATEGHDDVLVPVAKLGTGDASASVYLRGDGMWATAVGGGGLDQAAVDARVVAGTLPQARTANTEVWPVAKLGSGSPSTSTFLRGDGSWQSVPSGGLASVASDSTLTGDGTSGSPLGVADGAINSAKIANQGVQQADLASNSVGGAQVIDRSLLPSELNPAGSTDGQLLTSTGPSSDPAWEALSVTHAMLADDVGGHNHVQSAEPTWDGTFNTLTVPVATRHPGVGDTITFFMPDVGTSATNVVNLTTSLGGTPAASRQLRDIHNNTINSAELEPGALYDAQRTGPYYHLIEPLVAPFADLSFDTELPLSKVPTAGSSDGQVLTSTGPDTDPAWETPAGGNTANAELEASWALHANNTTPAGITWCGDRFLVADADDHLIYRYMLDGTYVDTWALQSGNTASRGVACTGTEVLVVNDLPADHAVYRYMLDGTYISKWTLNLNNGSPLGMTWDGTEVHVLNSINNLVFRYSATGTFNTTWGLSGSNSNAVGITWTGENYLVTDHNDALVYRYGAQRNLLGTWAHGGGNTDSQGITFANSRPYVLDEDDNVYEYVFAAPAPATWARASGATGTAPVARLGTGTANAQSFLRGDGAWARKVEAWAVFPALSGAADVWFAGTPSDSYTSGITLGSYTLSGVEYSTFTVTEAGDYVIELDIPFVDAAGTNHGFDVARASSCPTTATEAGAGASAVAERTFARSGRWFGAAAVNDCFWMRAPSSAGTNWPAGAVFSMEKVGQ